MSTIGEAAAKLESRLFVGRESELRLFAEWMDKQHPEPAILSITGPGGVGKTSLMRAFEREAIKGGNKVIYADAHTVPSTNDALCQVIAGPRAKDTVGYLNELRPVLMLDTFEELGPCERFLYRELLPQLDESIRVVLASRKPLREVWRAWSPFIQDISLAGLSQAEGREYLARRSLTDPVLVASILRATGGNPLALSLAADLALQFRIKEFNIAAEWRLTVRGLVDNLISEGAVPAGLRELLEAASIVRQFDEETLAAVVDRQDISEAFEALCQLSVVRAAEHGLMIHDDVRSVLAEDLRSREPERHDAYRMRALRHYGLRMKTATSSEARWLVADQIYCCQDALVRALAFAEEHPGDVSIQRARPHDLEHILRILKSKGDPAWAVMPSPEELTEEFVVSVFSALPHIFDLACARDGTVLGYQFILPIDQENMPMLPKYGAIRSLVDKFLEMSGITGVPVEGERPKIHFLSGIIVGADKGQSATAALARNCLGRMVTSDILLACSANPDHQAAILGAGFEPVPGSEVEPGGTAGPLRGFYLDKSLVGNEGWINALSKGEPLPKIPRGEALERELSEILEHWRNDKRLLKSSLLPLASLRSPDSLPSHSKALRALIQDCLKDLVEEDESQRLPVRALEISYMQPIITAEMAAERLSVSRATLFRLRKRAISALAEALQNSARSFP